MIRAFNLGLVLFLIWFLNVSFQEKQLNNISANEILGTEDTPDFYSEDLQIRQYNDQGKLESYITTKRLSHYVDKQYAILDAPQLMLYGKDGSVKNISSTYGELNDRSRDLKLSDSVVLIVSDKDNNQTLKVVTAELSYSDSEQRIWSDSKVKGDSEQGTFNSNKLQMDTKSEQLTLKDKVQIYYEQYRLNISADLLTSNPETDLSRLKGQVNLVHENIIISGDAAEVQSAKDKQQQFIITGEPVNFKQNLAGSSMTAKTRQLVYFPSLERMDLEGRVEVIQKTANFEFEIKAAQIQIQFREQSPFRLDAVGEPAYFIHRLADRTVMIDAKNIVWQAEANIAVLTEATVQDGQTTFSADEINYNTLTGEISATGSGNSRPSYQYTPSEDKEKQQANDS
ncbi:MAG: LPS export ABC transporter periplasmic protein LptC [Gammaproteobacteria bacterium]|nr:MAG: LPS export ABC transporter periplasmic protein LptC [Gammaproteobacteria bacterium]